MLRGGQHRVAVCTALLLILTGCALQPAALQAPAAPAGFQNVAESAAVQWPSKDWYRGFGSDTLDTLIASATDQNLDVAAARSRIAQADARARQAGAAILPSIDGVGNGNFLAGRSADGSAHEFDWSALVSTSYEVDFWGKNRALRSAARLAGSAARADRDTLALTTLAGVANGYFELLSIREQLRIAQSNLGAAQGLLDIVQTRFNAGLSDPVTLAAQRTLLATAQMAVPTLKQREQEALSALALLVGQPPEDFQVADMALGAMTEPHVTPGLPAQLLVRRPDVFSAEANLRAADANVVAARAALLPTLTLTAAGGVQNPAMNAAVIALAGIGPGVNLGAGLMQSIFDGGRLRAARDEARARDEELVLEYRKAILAALVDVENALSGLHNLDAAHEFQDEKIKQAQQTFDGAQLRYREGAGDFLALLEAQRSLYAARDEDVQYRLARLQALVALCKALGGGWENQE